MFKMSKTIVLLLFKLEIFQTNKVAWWDNQIVIWIYGNNYTKIVFLKSLDKTANDTVITTLIQLRHKYGEGGISIYDWLEHWPLRENAYVNV